MSIIQGLDLIDIIKEINKKNRKYTRFALQELEEVLGKDSPEYKKARKVFLDYFNEYTRSVGRAMFGDIEVAKYVVNKNNYD